MNTENTISRWDDVVFENRNKAYGAYSIRSAYDKNLSRASIASFLFVGCLFATAQVAMMLKPEIRQRIIDPPIQLFLKDIKIVYDQDKVQPKEIVKPKAKSDAFPTKVVTHEVVDTKPTEVMTTSSGTEGPVGPGESVDPALGTDIGVAVAPVVVEPPKTFDHAEVMPEFEGGLKALYRFLNKNLHYPSAARSQGQEGTVMVRFVVDYTGAITNIEIIRTISGTLDKEAERVIALMPKWKPGRQHDSPVNVRMVLPITFKITE